MTKVLPSGALVAAALSLACHSGSSTPSEPQPGKEGGRAAVAVKPSVPQGPFGSIEGDVSYDGAVPAPEQISTALDPTCGASRTHDPVRVQDGKLADVVVRVTDADLVVPSPAEPVVFTQKGCEYLPHVLGAVEGQRIEIRNGDPTMHNVHAFLGRTAGRTLFNSAQPPGAGPIERTLTAHDGVVRVNCDVHPWMQAFAVVNHNPYFGVSGEHGQFRIEHVPVGHHHLVAWHEKLGTVEADVDVTADQPSAVHVTFHAVSAAAERP